MIIIIVIIILFVAMEAEKPISFFRLNSGPIQKKSLIP